MTDEQIDAGARALREHQMAGRMSVEWARVPKAQKRKWIEAARIVIAAAEGLENKA